MSNILRMNVQKSIQILFLNPCTHATRLLLLFFTCLQQAYGCGGGGGGGGGTLLCCVDFWQI